MDRQQADLLVRELGERLGLPDLALGENGMATIAIESGPIVTLGYATATGTLELMTCLDTISLSPSLMREVLGANFAWIGTAGASFAIEAPSNALVLQRRCSAADAANGGLFAIVESLIATAENWTARLSTLSEPSTARTDTGSSAIPTGMVRA